jgi:mRNA-degrading endonuclease RelE of RelBE toxin-antitoxin system
LYFRTKTPKNQDLFRQVRLGDYRIIYGIDDNTITVLVLAIGHRKEVYDCEKRESRKGVRLEWR